MFEGCPKGSEGGMEVNGCATKTSCVRHLHATVMPKFQGSETLDSLGAEARASTKLRQQARNSGLVAVLCFGGRKEIQRGALSSPVAGTSFRIP